MSQIKLTYFGLRARAEPARLVLAYAGVKYTDQRISAPWDSPAPWAAMKPTTPYGQIPLLHWDGEVIAQSMAITRFLAAQFGLKGKNNLESALIDEVVDTIEDVINVTIKTHFETDPVKKAETVSQLNESTILPMLVNIEKRLVSRGGQFLVGNALSLADIHLFFFCSEYTTPKLLANTPKIANLVKRVEYLPNIQKWLKNRPVSKL
eukprot:TRINITY_DN2_c0_g1_i2.p1 TRINITY_DN2_c0_g1~~TRINITY_DN2_c0_g1_i2.p1  ORF type:complete len:207 (-),score=77.50 TRINITY_DN2_c0_g1_i2:109-729(-)